MNHIFIIGSKGIPAKYGGYETFVEKLTEYSKNNKNLKYYVACKNSDNTVYNNAMCFGVKVPNIGAAQAIVYDVLAICECIRIVKDNKIDNFVVYILACRIGPFMDVFVNKIHKLGGKVYINPDGHEWKRAKWNYFIKKYWKHSERLMVKRADLVICDSVNIQKYICKEYNKYNPTTTYISYGAEIDISTKSSPEWYSEHEIEIGNYYLIVGRFVPENNYETIIREYMGSHTKKSLVIITNTDTKFLNKLQSNLNYRDDKRINFVGTVYDEQMLKYVRENAYAYIHGHEVGGTNPSLLEALSSTKLNLLLDVSFNREVGEDGCLYWNKTKGNLANLIDKVDFLSKQEIESFSKKSKKNIAERYSWGKIIEKYNKLFESGKY